MDAAFDDILQANAAYAAGDFDLDGLNPKAAKRLGVLTCIDSRIEPLAMLGLKPGDAKIFRNAGARASDDAVRSLVLATNLLGVERIMVVAHTECAMANTDEAELIEEFGRRYPGVDLTGVELGTMDDQHAALARDVQKIRDCPLLPPGIVVGGFEYDVHSGRLRSIVP